MKSKEYAISLAQDRANKMGKPYIAYRVRNGQWMVDPLTPNHEHKYDYAICEPAPGWQATPQDSAVTSAIKCLRDLSKGGWFPILLVLANDTTQDVMAVTGTDKSPDEIIEHLAHDCKVIRPC